MADLDELANRLYALPPEQFTAARDEQVALARRAGDRDGARRLGALRRPTVAAWLVNLLARERPEALDELFELGAQLRTAQHELRGGQLRELSGRRRAVVDGLAAQVPGLARAAGRPARENLPLDDVVATLNAALADAEVAAQVRAGRLVRPASYAGFGELPKPVLRVVEGGAQPEAEKAEEPAPPGAARAARAAAARERLAQAEADLAGAEREYRRADTELAGAQHRLEQAQQAYATAQAQLSHAALRRRSAQRAVTVAARAVPDG